MTYEEFRIGSGYDLHRLVAGRRLWLGGVHIPHDLGEAGHSDGDVLVHAVIDALLGGAGLGDIGEMFPPEDPAYKDATGASLLAAVMGRLRREAWRVENLDCTVVIERPKLSPYKPAVAESLASMLGIGRDRVSVKAKTKEGVDAVGEGRAVEAFAVVLLARPGPG